MLVEEKAAEDKTNPLRWPEGTVTEKFIQFWGFELIFITLHWVKMDHWTMLVVDYASKRWSHLDPMGKLIPRAQCCQARAVVERFLVKRARAQGITISFDGWEYVRVMLVFPHKERMNVGCGC